MGVISPPAWFSAPYLPPPPGSSRPRRLGPVLLSRRQASETIQKDAPARRVLQWNERGQRLEEVRACLPGVALLRGHAAESAERVTEARSVPHLPGDLQAFVKVRAR